MNLNSKLFGLLPDGKEVYLYHLENTNGISIEVSNYGCTITSIRVPDRNAVVEDIVAGYRTFEEWISNPAYFGSLIGRTCNRIAGARFSIDGTEYEVAANFGTMQLHGGFEGFSHKVWNVSEINKKDEVGLSFEYLSKDGEEGFPGNLRVKATYTLDDRNEFKMVLQAFTDKATPVNLTNHCYFNLRGEHTGIIYNQRLQIIADYITESDTNSIPTGKLIPVKDTPFDFTKPQEIGKRIHELSAGYDDNFVLRKQPGELSLAAVASDPSSGRVLEIFTTEPGIQLYTSNWFKGEVTGKGGIPYYKHHAFALETQHFPDSMNHPEFPGIILIPGQKYYSCTSWRFSNE